MINTDLCQVIYSGDGVTTEFAYTFPIINKTDIHLTLVDTDGSESEITSDYYVDATAKKVIYPGYEPGSSVPESDRPAVLAEGQKLIIYREVPVTQLVDMPTSWPWDVNEDMHDKSCIIDQQLKADTDRALKVSRTVDLDDFDGTVPVPTDDNNHGIRITKDGFELVRDPQDAYDAAAAEAAAAKVSETNAKESETNAAASAEHADNVWGSIPADYQSVLYRTSIWATPEEFGYKDGDDLAITIASMLAQGYKYIQLLPKNYTVKSTIQLHDIVGGGLRGANTFESESKVTASNGVTNLICREMNGKAVISICGCLNVPVENISIVGEDVDSADIGIYMGRSETHKSCQWCHIKGCRISLLETDETKCNNNGSIGIYNNACEEFEITNCSFTTTIACVHTAKDCFDLASYGNDYNYSGATCTVIYCRNWSVGGKIVAVIDNVSSISIKDIFYFNGSNFTTPIFIKVVSNNNTSLYLYNLDFECHAEQNVNNLLLLDSAASTVKINFSKCVFKLISLGNVAHDYLNLCSFINVFSKCHFKIADKASYTTSILMIDFSKSLTNVSHCYIDTTGYIKLSNSTGNFMREYVDVYKLGAYGPSSSPYPQFPFQVNGLQIGSSYNAPTFTSDVNSNSIAICTNDGARCAFWVYKPNLNGWAPVYTNVENVVENNTLKVKINGTWKKVVLEDIT